MICDFEEILEAYMDEKGLNQTELARKLNVSNSQLSGWLTGKSFPTRQNLEKIEEFLTSSADFEYLETSKKLYAPQVHRSSPSSRCFIFIPNPYRCYDFYSQIKRSCPGCGFYSPQFYNAHQPSREAKELAEKEGLFTISLSDLFFENSTEEEVVSSRSIKRSFEKNEEIWPNIRNVFSTVEPTKAFIECNHVSTVITTKRADFQVEKVIYV